jgi:hypothetical protein
MAIIKEALVGCSRESVAVLSILVDLHFAGIIILSKTI